MSLVMLHLPSELDTFVALDTALRSFGNSGSPSQIVLSIASIKSVDLAISF